MEQREQESQLRGVGEWPAAAHSWCSVLWRGKKGGLLLHQLPHLAGCGLFLGVNCLAGLTCHVSVVRGPGASAS